MFLWLYEGDVMDENINKWCSYQKYVYWKFFDMQYVGKELVMVKQHYLESIQILSSIHEK